jgi:preprotein translocase subunit YajC
MFDNLPLQLVLAQEDAAPRRPDQGSPTPVPGQPSPSQAPSEDGPPPATTTNPTPTGDPNQAGPGGPGGPGGLFGGGGGFMILLLVFLVLMFGMTAFSQRKEKKKRAKMLESLSKNDRVVTIGGIIGTIVEVKDNEVVLKVDESSNTRMRFSRSSIQGVMNDES